MDLFELGVKIDTTQIAKAEKAIESLIGKLKGADFSLGDTSGSGGDTSAPIERKTKAVERYAKMTNTVAGALQYQKQAMDAINKSYDKGKFSVELYDTAVTNVKTKVESAINAINRKSDAFKQEQLAQKQATAEANKYNAVMEKSQILASKTNLSVSRKDFAQQIALEKQATVEANKAERAEASLERKRNSLASTTASLAGVTFRYEQKLKDINTLFPESIRDTDRYRAAVANAHAEYQNSVSRINAFNKVQEMTGTKTRLARHEMLNLSYQLQDIVVGFASGQRPMTIFIQQGAQIAGIASAAGLGLKGMAAAMLDLVSASAAAVGRLMLNPYFLLLTTTLLVAKSAYDSFTQSITNSTMQFNGVNSVLAKTNTDMDTFKQKLDAVGGASVTLKDIFSTLFTSLHLNEALEGWQLFGDWLATKFYNIIRFVYAGYKSLVELVHNGLSGMGAITEKSLSSSFEAGNKAVQEFDKRFKDLRTEIEKPLQARVNFVISTLNAEKIKQTGNDFFNLVNQLSSPLTKLRTDYQNAITTINEALANGTTNEKTAILLRKKAWADYTQKRKEYLDQISKKENKLAEKRSDIVDGMVLGYDNEIAKTLALTEEQKTQLKLTQTENELRSKGFAPLTEKEISNAKEKSKALADANKVAEEYARIQGLINQVVSNSKTPLDVYNDSITGLVNAYSEGKIGADEYRRQADLAKETYKEATNPLLSYTKALDNEVAQLSMNNDERELYNYQLQLEDTYSKELVGATEKRTQAIYEEIAALVERKRQLIGQQKTQTRIQSYTPSRTVADITTDVRNLKGDFKSKKIDAETYTNQLSALNKEYLTLQASTGKATFMEGMQLSMINFLGDYKNVMGQLSNITTNFLDSFSSGFADAFAGAIVKGDNLKESLQNVSQTILTELVSALIQMGIKYAIGTALGETMTAKQLLNIQAVSTAQTAATVKGTAESTAAATTVAANAGTVAAASAPAAATTSTWSFGAAAAAGAAGMLALLAVAKMFTSGFKEGGYTGNFGTSDVAGVVHGQEFVVNADATAKNRALLEAMNNGATVTGGSSTTATTQATNNMTYNHTSQITINGNPDNTTLALIAQAVEQGAKKGYALVAQDFKNNGNLRKAVVGNK